MLPLAGIAQPRFLPSVEQARRATEGIVASAAAGNVDGALQVIRPLSVASEAELDKIESHVRMLNAKVVREVGAAEGYEFIDEEKLGNRLSRFRYLVFHERAAVQWDFVVYRTERGWAISHFGVHGNAMAFFGQ